MRTCHKADLDFLFSWQVVVESVQTVTTNLES